ncbi:MAG: hypothetical protein KAT43_02640 [Nanoarchaeota archaeon]|nr:hypothetical protein [Nanoarchaeota archaeon]
MGIESLLGSVKNLLGSTVGKVGTTVLLGAGLLFGGGCDEEEDPMVVDEIFLSATAGSYEVALSWKLPKDEEDSDIHIQRKQDTVPTDIDDGTLVYEGQESSYIDSGLEADVLYCYKAFVISYSNPTYSYSSLEASATPFDGIPPGEVLTFGTYQIEGAIEISWTPPTDPDFAGVILRRKTGSNITGPSDGDLVYDGNSQTELVDGNLTVGVTYFYRIYTYDDSNNFSFGNTHTETPLPEKSDTVTPIGWIGAGSDGWKTTNDAVFGHDLRSFCYPYGICVDSSGNIYVADQLNNRVTKWDSAGNAVAWIGGGSDGWKTSSPLSVPQVSDYRGFSSPTDICVDGSGNLYVLDRQNNRVSKWDSNGNAVGWIGGGSNGWKQTNGASSGSDYQSFWFPIGLALDSVGNMYVVDGYSRICKWTGGGNAVGWIGNRQDGWQNGSSVNFASDYKSFLAPTSVFVDHNNFIYVADHGNNRISKWYASGNAIGWIGGGSNGWKQTLGTSSGTDHKSFNEPRDVFVDLNGSIYIADTANNRICRWDSNGNAFGWIGNGFDGWKTGRLVTSGSDYRNFSTPRSIFVDGSSKMFIAEVTNNRISTWQD